MRRAIVGFQQDDAGEWAARLSCLHGQHIRHRPPFQLAPWVLDAAEREARIGQPLECPLCDRAELPGDLEVVRTIDGEGVGLPGGTWGLVRVHAGPVRVTLATEPPIEVVLEAGSSQPVPPEVDYSLVPSGDAGFSFDVLTRPASI
ncbi:MAG: DUF3565 domain-containing protein [Acidimicrobiales bacterium]